MKISLCGLAVLVTVMVGCGAPEKTSLVTWENYDGKGDPNRAVYTLDGQRMGKGEDGWRAVLSRLKELSPGGTVYIYPCYPMEDDIWDGRRWERGRRKMPFQHHRSRRSGDLAVIAMDNELRIWFTLGPPGYCVCKETGDIRRSIWNEAK